MWICGRLVLYFIQCYLDNNLFIKNSKTIFFFYINLWSVDELINSIIKGKVEFEKKIWKNISDSAKDLVKKCLTVNPAKRITPQKALSHPWIVNYKIFIYLSSIGIKN